MGHLYHGYVKQPEGDEQHWCNYVDLIRFRTPRWFDLLINPQAVRRPHSKIISTSQDVTKQKNLSKLGTRKNGWLRVFFFPPLTLVLSHVVSTAVTLDGSSRIRLLGAALLQLSQHLLVILAKAKKTAGNDWRYWYLTSGLGSSSYSTLSYFINLYWLQKSLIQ